MKSILIMTLSITLMISGCQTLPNPAQQQTFIQKYRADKNNQTVYLKNQQATIHYQRVGDPKKPLMVLMHGVNASYDTWDGWLAQGLLAHYQVLRFDMPPFGLSHYDNPDTINLATNHQLIHELLDTLKVTAPVTLVGNSYGGYLAWSFAAAYPKRTSQVVLIDSSGYQNKPPFIIKMGQNKILSLAYLASSPCYIVNHFYKQTYGEGKNNIAPEVKQRYCDLSQQRPSRAAISQFYQNNNWQDTSFLNPLRPAQVKAPTLILWGQKDSLIPLNHATRFEQDIPNSKLIIYPTLGHVPMEEDPATTLRDVLGFLKKR